MQIEVPLEDGSTQIFEISGADISDDLVQATGANTGMARARATLESALQSIQPTVQAVRNALAAAGPTETTVEFGIKIGGESSVILAKGTIESNFVVKVTWK